MLLLVCVADTRRSRVGLIIQRKHTLVHHICGCEALVWQKSRGTHLGAALFHILEMSSRSIDVTIADGFF